MSMFDTIKETFGFGGGDNDHPALKNYSRPLEMGKHVVKKTIKSALWTAAVVGVAAAIIPGAIAALPLVGGLVGTSGVLSAAMGGAQIGAILGGIIGFGKGVSGMDEAADNAEEQRMMSYSRNAQRAKADATFAMQMGQQMGGVSPQALGFGRMQAQSQERNT